VAGPDLELGEEGGGPLPARVEVDGERAAGSLVDHEVEAEKPSEPQAREPASDPLGLLTRVVHQRHGEAGDRRIVVAAVLAALGAQAGEAVELDAGVRGDRVAGQRHAVDVE